MALLVSALAGPLAAGDERAVYFEGMTQAQESKWAAAEVKFRRAIEIKNDYAEAWNKLGWVLFNQARMNEAIAVLKKAETINPRLTEAVYNLGWAYENQHKDAVEHEVEAEGKTMVTAVYRDPKLIKKIRKSQFELAEAAYRRAVAIRPMNDKRAKADAHYRLGALLARNALAEDAKNPEMNEAIEHEEIAVSLYPDFFQARTELGKMYDVIGRYPAAIEQFDQAIAANRNYAPAWTNRGVAYWHDGNWDNALRDTQKSIELDPKFAYGHYNFAEVVYAQAQVLATDEKRAIRREEIERAMEHFRIAVELEHAVKYHPEFYQAWLRLGDAYLSYFDLDAAEKHFNEILEVVAADQFSEKSETRRAKAYAKEQLKWIKNERKRLDSHVPSQIRSKGK
jgi:tetratricopeptide (TPR) repeat protein